MTKDPWDTAKSIRFSREELEIVKTRAREEGLLIENFVRQMIRREGEGGQH